ncbi:MAG: D-alanine--poly(phosphoribitol) ligase subunit 1 [Bacteroidales bacterium]|nr:D-alanine--poly(phosphoribitol) ligase subunit 1 [Bacteroidales bacterium]
MIVNTVEYLEITAKKNPENIAFYDEDSQITFEQLRDTSKRVGSKIIQLLDGVRNVPVAILTDRNIKSIISYFGVLYSGNFYVPINKAFPVHRIKKILEILNPKIIIYLSDDDFDVIRKLDFEGKSINLNNALDTEIDEDRIRTTVEKMIDTDPMYAVFTSGSTGTPKCVLLSHRSVIDIVEQFSLIFDLTSETVFGNVAPLDYSGSTKDIYITIRNGGKAHIIPKSYFSFPKKLLQYLDINKINTLNTPVSALRILANYKAFDTVRPSSLSKFLFFGELMPVKMLNYFQYHYPDALFVNLYGSTEKTCLAYFIVNRHFTEKESLPIGVPFRNTNIILLNDQDQILENEDEIGEICIRGAFALGYYNDIQSSEKTFSRNPVNLQYQEKIFRTGDLGKFNSNGELILVSRMDSQVKHWGYRIELGEIEIAVNSIDFVDFAFCKFDAEKDKIVLFYQSGFEKDKELLVLLRNQFPQYMLPNQVIHYVKFPLKNNMKIDRIKIWEKYLKNLNTE